MIVRGSPGERTGVADDRPVDDGPYPPLADYGLLGDCHSVALVSRSGSIDWCCMPRLDEGACFGRILDWSRGGHCEVGPSHDVSRVSRRYLDRSLVLETRFECRTGVLRLIDFFAMTRGGREHPRHQLIRIVDALSGEVDVAVEIVPRFDYGLTKPWLRRHRSGVYTALGGHQGLLLCGDADLEIVDRHGLRGRFTLGTGERRRLSLQHVEPHRVHPFEPPVHDAESLDECLEETLDWWEDWASRADGSVAGLEDAMSSACVIKGLIHAPTGAIAAAATTSLPECPGGTRNWDYRYTWIRDSAFALRSLDRLGFHSEARRFQRFVERTAAGNPDDLQIVYGVRGDRRLTELRLPRLEGYRGARPVRVGNAAHRQRQLDLYGDVLHVAWLSARRGDPPGDDYWRFLRRLVERCVGLWREPDRGIWEVRGEPRHFVYSKMMCWAAVDRGIRIAERFGFEAPLDHWRRACREIREAVESRGYDEGRGVFVQAFGRPEMDAAVLLLPRMEFVAYDDERMLRTVDAVREDLEEAPGLLRRYRGGDGIADDEGVFLACSFWLVECLVHQGRGEEARLVFERTSGLANDLGLFAEQADPRTGEMLGNFPQGLTHYSHIAAILALSTLPDAHPG